MREISVKKVVEAVKAICIESNCHLPRDVETAICESCKNEIWLPAKESLEVIAENIAISRENNLPLCQDTGAVCVFVTMGQDVHITGGSLEQAINVGVKQGYADGYLRKSIVADPLRRANTGDNTPAFITYNVVPGDTLHITVAPKGFGSENMSRLSMLTPSAGLQGVIDFVLETVELAGPNPCPPVVLGVGIGGTFDKVAALAKKALLRSVDERHPDPYYAELEVLLLKKVNQTGIGPQGFGGMTTALGVNIETLPTHIAGLPVAVNVNCHVVRHGEVTL